MKILIIFILLITSCSTIKESIILHHGVSIEKDFLPHVIEFENRCHRKISTNIYFKKNFPLENTIGFCFPIFSKTIYIKYNWWKSHGYYDNEQLLFHELGHCELKKMHNDTMIPAKDGGMRPLSIMHHILIPDYYYRNREEYIKKLCGNKNE